MTSDELRDRMKNALELDRAGRFEEAAAACDEMLAALPAQPHVLCLLGRIRRRQGRFDEAADSLERAYSIAPGLSQLRAELGFLALSRSDARTAVEHFSALVALAPGAADARFNLACALEVAGRHRESAAGFEAALALGAKAPHEVLARLGAALLMFGHEDEAAARFEESLAGEPEYSRALYGLGMVRGARGEFDAAADLFRRALAADPDFVEVYQQLAEIRRFADRDDADFVMMRELLAEPGRPAVAREKLGFALGKANDDLGDHAAAFSHYAEANRLKRARAGPFDRASHAALIDRTIETFSADFLPARPEFGLPDRRPIFICGMPRSGTTLVEQILSSHSRVVAAGEQSWFERLSLSMGPSRPEPVRNWSAADAQHHARDYLDMLDRFGDGAQRITDKMPVNFLNLGLIRLLLPQALLIHCRRDPIDTCLSIFFQDFGTGNYYANDLEDIAFYYREYARLMEHWRRVLPGAVFDVDYSALVRDQEGITRDVLAFCGLEWEDGCLSFAGNERLVATLSRWQVRQPIYTDSLGRRDKYAPYIGVLEAALGPRTAG